MTPHQYADPTVSRAKFDREISEYRSLEREHRARGWLMTHAEFPSVFVVLATPKCAPSAIVTGVAFDYTNYDAAPPSVRLVHPFTGEPYKFSEMPTPVMRSLPDQQFRLPGMADGAPQFAMQAQLALMQALAPDDIPFLCLAGVREYHEHPAHTGDAWELHRSSGAGRLVRLLEVIARYGVEPINGFGVQLAPKVVFAFGPPPP